jgi:hypothetical protein
MRLAEGDMVARDKGVNLSSYYTTDFLGTSRPQGAAWDIGAFEYKASNMSAPANFRKLGTQ